MAFLDAVVDVLSVAVTVSDSTASFVEVVDVLSVAVTVSDSVVDMP